MENVVAFNSELSSLYESKPPISKAKMASITRAAMKAIKFYKHVVQSVEKFILKCKPEYKVPGLYVIDSIVRQSRHQFGAEKDVFAPRFARNMKQTFANLFRCASDDKSRIIRVLNLWQKNNVFAPEVIQPLFDLADPNHPIYQQQTDISSQDLSSISNGLNTSGIGGVQDNVNTSNMSDDNHLQSSDITMSHQGGNTLDQNTIRQLQQLQQILIRQTTNDGPSTTSSGGAGGGIGNSSQSDSIKFNKKVLDYDYGEDEEEEKTDSPHITNILDSKNLTQLLKDPNVLRQLQTIQKFKEQEEKQSKLKEMRIQEEAFEKHVQNVLKGSSGSSMGNTVMNESHIGLSDKNLQNLVDDGPVIEVINLEDGNDSRSSSPDRDRSYKRRRSSRSRSRDRGGGGGRSGGGNDRDRDGRDRRRRSTKSRSRSRSPRSNRRRSSRERDRERDRDRDRSSTTRDKDKEREKEREYERERRRKGLPDIKKEHLTVCSNTLWVGHLSKLVHQEELSDTFGKYGDIISIDMIYPRGCAFIVMNRRQDAFKAMQNLKNHKLQGRAITISWAAGKGVKSKEWKDYWDLDLGVSYIPWSKLDENTDLDALEEGGMFDEDTMPGWMKQKINQKKETQEKKTQQVFNVEGSVPPLDTSQPPPGAPGAMMSGVPLIPQFSPMGPVSRMMPPPLGVPIPGNMVPGLPMTPNMVPGIPPPHMMMPPPGGMVPGFPAMGGPMDKSMTPQAGVPQQDGPPASLPPPFMTTNIGNMHIPPNMAPQQSPFGPMGIPPQFQHALSNQPVPPAGIGNINQGDDHMDIEMEDENPPVMNKLGGQSGPQPLFNQPPPLFSSLPNEMPLTQLGNENQRNERESRGSSEDRRDVDFGRGSRSRDNRNSDFNNKRDKEQNRWGPPNPLIGDHERDRSSDRDKMNNVRDFNRNNGSSQQEPGRPIPSIWQDNGPGPNFQPPPLFGDNQRRGPMDIPPLDAQQHLQRLHFDMRRNNDFPVDDRRGGFQQQQQQRDFFQNINNLNIPNMGNMGRPPPQNLNRNAPMPMRSPFGPRLGPMFARGPPGRQGPPGFNFNDRPIFDREDGRGGGNGGVGGGGGGSRGRNNDMPNRRGGRNNDENRRGNSGGRFQNRDRDGPNDRRGDKNDRERDRGRDRNRGGRDRNNDRDGQRDRSSRKGSSEPRSQNDASQNEPVQPTPHDTEEDWDNELSEHNVEQNSNNNQEGEEQQQEQQFEHQQEHFEQQEQQQQQEQSENLETWDSADENAFDNSFDEQSGGDGRNSEIEKDTENTIQCSDSTNFTTNNDNQDFMSVDNSQGENNEIVD